MIADDVLTSDDGLAPMSNALSAAVAKVGGAKVKTVHVTTDHSWSDARVRLQAALLNWLGALPVD